MLTNQFVRNTQFAFEEIRLSHVLSMLQNTEYEVNNYDSNQSTGLDEMARPVYELKIAL